MKIKTLSSSIKNDIEATAKRKEELKKEIAETKENLAGVVAHIQNYDSDDINGFKELTDTRTFYEHRLEMLNRKYEQNNSIDEARRVADFERFKEERKEVIRNTREKILPLVELNEIQEEAFQEMDVLERIYKLWMNTYNISPEYRVYGATFGVDDGGLLVNTRVYANNMLEIIKK